MTIFTYLHVCLKEQTLALFSKHKKQTFPKGEIEREAKKKKWKSQRLKNR